jgi:hypothetical protein
VAGSKKSVANPAFILIMVGLYVIAAGKIWIPAPQSGRGKLSQEIKY